MPGLADADLFVVSCELSSLLASIVYETAHVPGRASMPSSARGGFILVKILEIERSSWTGDARPDLPRQAPASAGKPQVAALCGHCACTVRAGSGQAEGKLGQA